MQDPGKKDPSFPRRTSERICISFSAGKAWRKSKPKTSTKGKSWSREPPHPREGTIPPLPVLWTGDAKDRDRFDHIDAGEM